MDELIAFLVARYDETEAEARDWQPHERYPEDPNEMDTRWNLIPSYTPARVLRDIEAKRKRLASYSAARAAVDRYDDQYMAGVASGLADAIKDDSAVWSDHPDYREDWVA